LLKSLRADVFTGFTTTTCYRNEQQVPHPVIFRAEPDHTMAPGEHLPVKFPGFPISGDRRTGGHGSSKS